MAYDIRWSMKTVHVDQTATVFDLVEQAKREPILLLEQAGRTFVLIQVDGEDADALRLADNPKLWQILEASRARARREGWLSTKQIREQLGVESDMGSFPAGD